MGGTRKFPYPKDVWSPAGGWWPNPYKWKSNTLIVAGGLVVFAAVTWKISADREWRHSPPNRWIPSMLWSKQFKEGEYKDLKFSEDE
ncbi:7241_t:CDS:2 [Paraglomus occultum]|uniref:7241_t:CDS:1 n=1 Tax=Paraglomus occultum TaxID=144539 RepID=A0A9N9AXS9_9GLOM|nr:7241_t:CDS:2 [Paraglomus occultum]